MDETGDMAIARVLGAMTALIVRCCDPDAVLLFGSYAKGNTHAGSDIDLLVIGPFQAARWLRAQELKDMLGQFPIPVDLHLYTREELAVEARQPYSFLHMVQTHSVTLYKRRNG